MLFRVRVFDVLPIARDFVMDCLNHAVVVLDNRGQVLDANAVARALLPNPSGRVRHRPLEEVFPALHRRLPPVAGGVGGTPEVPLRLAGEERFWDLYVLPITEQGARIGTLILLTDMTARKHAEAERRRFEERLRHTQKLESLGVMAGGIAHDFNNLLTVILGNTELAQERLGPASPAAPLLQNVVKAASWAAAITNQMLTYAGKAPFVVAPVSLSALIEGMADLLRAVVPRQVSLEFDLAPDLPPVPADPALFRQVVMNLLSNAAEALGEQPGSVWVRTRLVEVRAEDLAGAAVNAGLGPGSHLLLEVADTGAGMDAATRARMFEPFFTTKFTGRGLGMAVVLGIVRGHGGAIFVHSEVGVGTQVRVVLPRAAGPVPREEPPHPPPPASAGVVRMRSATVLVVDDEEHVRRVAEQFLRLAGYRILTARDGAEALRVHQERAAEIDAVLLDLTMPDLTGDVVFQKLRERDPELPVILTSGYTEEVVVRQLPAGEPPEFLHKPYRGDELTAKVRTALVRAALDQARPLRQGH
jgi:signal transduction histidine kinase/CheY-like chemotaxis protein